jgi:hypothetical protein
VLIIFSGSSFERAISKPRNNNIGAKSESEAKHKYPPVLINAGLTISLKIVLIFKSVDFVWRSIKSILAISSFTLS